MNNNNPLLDPVDNKGPVTHARDLKFGDRIQIHGQFGSKPWRVSHTGDCIQITDVQYSFSDEYRTMSFEELDNLTWSHIGVIVPMWVTILSFGCIKMRHF